MKFMQNKKLKNWRTKSSCIILQILSGRSNVFLCRAYKTDILIDTGPGKNWDVLYHRLKSLQIDKLDYLILTHSHYDHAENTNRIKKMFNPKIIMHHSEALYLEKGENIAPIGTNWFTALITMVLKNHIIKMMRYEPAKSDINIAEFFSIPETSLPIEIIHTPGHTRGSLSIIIDKEIALVGDTLFGIFKSSIFPPFAEDKKAMLASWGKLLETNCTLYFPSHGRVISRQKLLKDFNKRNPTSVQIN